MLVYFQIFGVQNFLGEKSTSYTSFHHLWYCRFTSMHWSQAENGF